MKKLIIILLLMYLQACKEKGIHTANIYFQDGTTATMIYEGNPTNIYLNNSGCIVTGIGWNSEIIACSVKYFKTIK